MCGEQLYTGESRTQQDILDPAGSYRRKLARRSSLGKHGKEMIEFIFSKKKE